MNFRLFSRVERWACWGRWGRCGRWSEGSGLRFWDGWACFIMGGCLLLGLRGSVAAVGVGVVGVV